MAYYLALGLAPKSVWRHGDAAMNDPAPVKLSDMPGLPVTRTRDLGVAYGPAELGAQLAARIAQLLEQPHA